MNKKEICHIIIMGDSLSDRGTADKATILGCIPMSWLAGLEGNSPKGRFANGYVWADVISSMFASKFMISQFKRKYKFGDDDIADAIIHHDKRVTEIIERSYTLDDDRYVTFDGRPFIRSYDEGGLSAYDYAWKPSTSITRFFSRIILSTLEDKRKLVLDYDEKKQVSAIQKAHTLVIEWSGANDLITVNAKPSKAEVDRAIKERVKNVEILIKNGYRNFIWINLPDLSLTPRYQNQTGKKGDDERANAHTCSNYFNSELDRACQRFKTLYPQCSFDVYDINATFIDAYHHPEKYELDPNKLKKAFIDSPDFKMLPNDTAPSNGYAFWDDVHPTADVHTVLGTRFYNEYNPRYDFVAPKPENAKEASIKLKEADLCNAFRSCYAEKLVKEQHSFFGAHHHKFRHEYANANLQQILKDALYEKGTLSREVLTELQWIDSSGEAKINIPVLHDALKLLHASQNTQAANDEDYIIVSKDDIASL
ncbi:SGNH/GDSL hydrolase family protein [uncultured Legionella sp.]|uniref:SGNH/GDSL hydrolase family protein n=1 Tax=uncultured Legionella sp. TaxID=210934 RepID=UPI00262E1889|nr:SGNH/GDSL hydrolase family protein [uncultured Legionella sp.]